MTTLTIALAAILILSSFTLGALASWWWIGWKLELAEKKLREALAANERQTHPIDDLVDWLEADEILDRAAHLRRREDSRRRVGVGGREAG